MNHLAPASAADDDGNGERYLLPKHAHIVVYERERDDVDGNDDDGSDTDGGDGDGAHETDRAGQLVTVYDCGAAQKPPSAQLLGELGSVRAACETAENPTGYVCRMREPAVLVDEGDGHFVVRSR
ncbi:hypothetical protein G9C85_07635 [Halorubellus sp. JP-L1]|uniref:hypothetical protein n=1 Tax=Halorubellus sp. JP-L1 TaxID=2715753 RepID=UPI001407D658|nr:hypothetical protein [Halorubellus sp. JP-L1]NHN41508.1 hypothetical protein [Halorubellus sp. JP-L1]